MKLRSREIGIGQTFYPFKRLPVELKHMIFSFTLEPRVVELLYKSCEDPKSDKNSNFEDEDKDIVFYSHAALPTALRVCHDSRAAVIGSYLSWDRWRCFPWFGVHQSRKCIYLMSILSISA